MALSFQTNDFSIAIMNNLRVTIMNYVNQLAVQIQADVLSGTNGLVLDFVVVAVVGALLIIYSFSYNTIFYNSNPSWQ